ncbi:MAG: hypothetical protein Q9209_000343 [Squamulea sp. 1 TL-2023]
MTAFERKFGTVAEIIYDFREQRRRDGYRAIFSLFHGELFQRIKFYAILHAVDSRNNSRQAAKTFEEQLGFVAIVRATLMIDALVGLPLWTLQERATLKKESKAIYHLLSQSLLDNDETRYSEPRESEDTLTTNKSTSNAASHYTRDMEALFLGDLDRVKSRVDDPDVSMLARSQRNATLQKTQSNIEQWKAECQQRKLRNPHSTEIRTIEKQARFLKIVKDIVELDSGSKDPLWTTEEQNDIMTVRKAAEDRLREDPHYSV